MKKDWYFSLGFIVLFLAGCDSASPPSYEVRSSAFGQPLHLEIWGVSPEQAEAAGASALTDLHFIEDVSHPWKPGPLGRTNQLLALSSEFSANPSILPMIRRATHLAEASQGYFNPALGNLRRLWGLHKDITGNDTEPSEQAIQALLAQEPDMRDIRLKGIRMQGNNPALRIDFGPFAQGYAVDTAIERLKEAGIPHARLVQGDIIVAVLDSEEVFPQSFRSDANPPTKTAITLRGTEALVHLSSRKQRYIDPHSGQILENAVASTVIAPSAADAAAAAQALLHVRSGGEGTLLERMGIDSALIKREGEPLILTKKMAERFAEEISIEQRLIPGRN